MQVWPSLATIWSPGIEPLVINMYNSNKSPENLSYFGLIDGRMNQLEVVILTVISCQFWSQKYKSDSDYQNGIH